MDTPEDIASLKWEELLALVAEQQQQITQLQGQFAKATATIESLQVEVERLTREQWFIKIGYFLGEVQSAE